MYISTRQINIGLTTMEQEHMPENILMVTNHIQIRDMVI